MQEQIQQFLHAQTTVTFLLQQDVANKAGVSRSTLHTLEHGGSGVRWEKVIAVADVLGLRLELTEG